MKTEYDAVCVDIETLSTRPDAVILQIGAVAFHSTGPEDVARWVCDVEWETSQRGRHVCADTLDWWRKQALNGKRMPGGGWFSLAQNLLGFREFVLGHCVGEFSVWAWGSDFDFPILEHATRDLGADYAMPWKHWQQRDARTLCEVLGIRRPRRATHDAVEDAADEVVAIRQALEWIGHDKWVAATSAEMSASLCGEKPREYDFEAGWNRYRRELAETHSPRLLPRWEQTPPEVRDCFAAGVIEACG